MVTLRFPSLFESELEVFESLCLANPSDKSKAMQNPNNIAVLMVANCPELRDLPGYWVFLNPYIEVERGP